MNQQVVLRLPRSTQRPSPHGARTRNGIRHIASVSCALVLSLTACGGSEDTADETTTVQSAGGEEVAAVAPTEWSNMNRDERLAYMQTTVNPEMQAMFQEFDGERFADFGCATCHGPNMVEADFAMPNGVAPLDPSHIPAMFASEQPMAVFMTREVWPRMGELLGEALYTEENVTGFSCMHCHATAEGTAM